VEVFVDAVLVASSIALFCYWFRYSCLLILSAETAHDYSREVARANQLSFPEVRSRLRKRDVADLDCLHKCLERDFAILEGLLEHAPIAGCYVGFEDVMLKILFRSMGVCFHLTRGSWREFASDALREMSLVVVHLANQWGERSFESASPSF
jgi:hypothetical protein